MSLSSEETHEDRVARALAEIKDKRRSEKSEARAYFQDWYQRHRTEVIAASARWQAANPARKSECNKAWYESKGKALRCEQKYGITLEQKAEILAAQGGVCGVCKTADARRGPWVVEHDHATLKVRSVSHRNCNSLLGYAEDGVELLRLAIEYLEAARGK